MFQREVAERIVAVPGSKAYGRLAILAQWRAEARSSWTLPPEAFTPPPKISSAVVHLTARQQPLFPADPKFCRAVVKAAFGQRRKMLRSALKGLAPDIEARLSACDIAPTHAPKKYQLSASRISRVRCGPRKSLTGRLLGGGVRRFGCSRFDRSIGLASVLPLGLDFAREGLRGARSAGLLSGVSTRPLSALISGTSTMSGCGASAASNRSRRRSVFPVFRAIVAAALRAHSDARDCRARAARGGHPVRAALRLTAAYNARHVAESSQPQRGRWRVAHRAPACVFVDNLLRRAAHFTLGTRAVEDPIDNIARGAVAVRFRPRS